MLNIIKRVIEENTVLMFLLMFGMILELSVQIDLKELIMRHKNLKNY